MGTLAFGAIAWVTFWLKSVLVRQQELNRELTRGMDMIRTLEGLLPICAWCSKVRDDHGSWKTIETYVTDHSNATWTHTICPDCARKVQGEVGGTAS